MVTRDDAEGENLSGLALASHWEKVISALMKAFTATTEQCQKCALLHSMHPRGLFTNQSSLWSSLDHVAAVIFHAAPTYKIMTDICRTQKNLLDIP